MSDSYLEIQISQQPIELCKLLKIANMVSGGGEAKVVISQGYVVLNGEVEFQKRKKIVHNDVIEFNGEMIQVIVNESLADTSLADKSTSAPKKPPVESHKKKAFEPKDSTTNSSEPSNTNNSTSNQRKRKPISF